MTQNEYIVITVVVTAVIVIISAVVHYLWSEKGTIGLRLIFIEMLCGAAVICALYYFEMPTDSVLKQRYKEKVFKKNKECFNKCVHACVGVKEPGK